MQSTPGVDPRQLPVVFVHGFLARAFTNAPLRDRLRAEGLTCFDVELPGLNTQDMRRSSAAVGQQVEAILAESGAARVLLVGVSMGGLIALHYVRRGGGHERIHRMVAVATPFNGTSTIRLGRGLGAVLGEAARQMHPGAPFIQEITAPPYPAADIVSIATHGDPMVHPDAARLAGARNIVTDFCRWPLGHYCAVLHPKSYAVFRDALLASA